MQAKKKNKKKRNKSHIALSVVEFSPVACQTMEDADLGVLDWNYEFRWALIGAAGFKFYWFPAAENIRWLWSLRHVCTAIGFSDPVHKVLKSLRPRYEPYLEVWLADSPLGIDSHLHMSTHATMQAARHEVKC